MAGPRKGGKKGGKKATTKKRKSSRVWDDQDPREKAGREYDEDGSRKKARTERGPRASMMAQWKQKKIASRQKERAFMSKTEQKKLTQRAQYEEQRRRLANAPYVDPSNRRDGLDHTSGENTAASESDSDDNDDDEEDDDASDEEQMPAKRKRRSVFDQFVEAFQPSTLGLNDMEDDDEEDEAEYEEIEVDEDGNPIELEEDDEDDADEDKDADKNDEEEGDNDDPVVDEDNDDDVVDDGTATGDDDHDVDATSDEDPYRSRYLLSEFDEADAKKFDTLPRKYTQLTADLTDAKLLPSSLLEEYQVSYRPGLTNEHFASLPTTLNVRSRLFNAWKTRDVIPTPSDSPLESALLHQFASYSDVFFAGQTYELTQPLRRVTAMHALNHVLKSRDTVIRNNERLRKQDAHANDTATVEDDEKEYRDQGYCRATVLVLLPLRSSAAAFVNELLALLPSTVDQFHNKDRFFDEYGTSGADDDDEEDDRDERNKSNDADLREWQRVFSEGNNDDSFQIGLSFSRRSLKFYSEYGQSDIILASPLGLRQRLGDEVIDVAEKQVLSTDFLSSIEICVLDSASLLLMQNVEHVRHVLQALNVKPREAPNADFARIREWNLAFLGAYFRQTIVFAHGIEPVLQNLIHKCCRNQSGVIKYVRDYDASGMASITHVVHPIKQIFQRIDLEGKNSNERVPRILSAADEVELRFRYFERHIFAPLLDSPRRHVLIFIPSYFDYVRIRNLFHDSMNQKLIRAVQCCEYTTNKQISRARTSFYHGKSHVMLFTERFHFYHQYQIRGIHQIIWYGLPQMGEFYPEMLNMLEDKNGENSAEVKSSIALFTRLDLFRLQRIVGQTRADRMCNPSAKKSTFLFC